MKNYIGTKMVQAEPCMRKAPSENIMIDRGFEEGYKVRYPDGYESWSPKEAFEAAYRPLEGLSFGQAIEAMKAGKKAARAGWNGENQHIELATAISYKDPAGRVVNVEHDAIGNRAIAFCGTSGVQMGWLASQADMLADDWRIVEEDT